MQFSLPGFDTQFVSSWKRSSPVHNDLIRNAISCVIHAFLGLEVFASRRDLDRRLCEGALGLRLSHHSVFISMKSIRRRGDKRDVRNEARRREWVAELHTVEGMNCSALQCIAAKKKVIAKKG